MNREFALSFRAVTKYRGQRFPPGTMSTTYRLFSWETKRKMFICSGRMDNRGYCVSLS